MKKISLLFLLLPFLGLSQVQIGETFNSISHDATGRSMSLSTDGTVLAIGAAFGGISNSGEVRVYENISGVWNQIGEDINGESPSDSSGISIDLSSDGNILAIGAADNDDTSTESGHVRVYENISGVWTQIGSDIDGEAFRDRFGGSVSLSSDGSIVAIGAGNNDGNGTDSGHVRVYENISGTWMQIGNDINGEASSDHSGKAISLSSDGSIVAIGAPFNDGNGFNSGHVRVYENISGTWMQIGSDIDGETTHDNFGSAISLSSNGNIIAISDYRNDVNGTDSGRVKVYENISGVWTQLGNDIDGESEGDQFGFKVSLSGEGDVLAIGAPTNYINGNNFGRTKIYLNVSNEWVQIGNITGELIGDFSGQLSISADGYTLAVGASDYNEDGYIKVYDLTDVLSIDKFQNSTFQLYPNPTKTQFTIQLNNTSTLEKVTIYNALGQEVLTSENTVVDTSKLASGSYIVEITTNTGNASKQLIIE